ncbi:Uncharacterized protein APZ42_027954 [Daphnia magna]|uniref:Uncharacterized protein n=1 Tax=Daphnia magna TaxID=35525 RepID=A0A164QXR2_9CRUS|nr:Uncharacterized protein APZ42_027954 [Daphnia magna]
MSSGIVRWMETGTVFQIMEMQSKLLSELVAGENIGARVFKKRKPNPVEQSKAVKLAFRSTWKGAPLVKKTALETDFIGDTGTYSHMAFARKLWLEDEKMADDRFETNSQEKEVGILIGGDQMFKKIPSEPAIQSPCGLKAYNTKLDDCDAVEPDDPLALLETKSPVKKMGYTAPHSRERRTRGELRSAYHKEIEQLQAENFTEEADINYKGVRTYLPHYPVVRYPTGQNNHKDSTGIRWGGITIRNMDQASTMFWKTA